MPRNCFIPNTKNTRKGVGMIKLNLNTSPTAAVASMKPEDLPERPVMTREEMHDTLNDLIDLHGHDSIRDCLSLQPSPLPPKP